MENFKIFTVSLLIAGVLTGNTVLAAEISSTTGAEKSIGVIFDLQQHGDELADFKQRLVAFFEKIPSGGPVSREEWETVHTQVLNDENWNKPISITNWAIFLKMILDPDNGTNGSMLDTYVYKQAKGSVITREAAIGGLIKLLNIKGYTNGESTMEELQSSKKLKDFVEIDFRQQALVQKAHALGLLDATVSDLFRPKDSFTNAEAASTLYRVIKTFGIAPPDPVSIPEGHWAASYIKEYVAFAKPSGGQVTILNNLCLSSETLDKPIAISEWNDLLWYLLKLDKSNVDKKFIEGYTYGLSKDGYITRDRAVAGLVKLLHVKGLVGWRDASEKEKAITAGKFTDFGQVFDQSKLSIANTEELISGYEDKTFGAGKLLTAGEALTLLGRVAKKYAVR